MRLSHHLERRSGSPSSSRRFRAFPSWIRGMVLAAALLIGLGATASPAAADSIAEDELDVIFVWVVNQESAEIAYDATASITDPEVRLTMREYLLLRLWVIGENPWAIDPNWEAPTGP